MYFNVRLSLGLWCKIAAWANFFCQFDSSYWTICHPCFGSFEFFQPRNTHGKVGKISQSARIATFSHVSKTERGIVMLNRRLIKLFIPMCPSTLNSLAPLLRFFLILLSEGYSRQGGKNQWLIENCNVFQRNTEPGIVMQNRRLIKLFLPMCPWHMNSLPHLLQLFLILPS